MTLVKIIRKYLFISMLPILVIGCISHYFIFGFFIHYSTDRMLTEQQLDIESYISEYDTLSLATTLVLEPARIEQKLIGTDTILLDKMFCDTIMYSEETGTFMPYRQLHFVTSYKGDNYLVTLNAPTMMTNDLFYAIIASLLVLVVLFIIFTYVIEYLLKKNIWKPLNQNMQKLQSYNLKANTVLELKNTGILEFDQISNVIHKMVDRINEDYDNSRVFIEDASHEMQTPLSIIKSKLDLLLQSESLRQDQSQQQAIVSMLRAVTRLSKLNKSLMLINKINNNQFENKKNVQFDKLLEVYLVDLEELFASKNLIVKSQIESFRLNVDPALVEMLLSNLLSNAFKYSTVGGKIDVVLQKQRLIITNSCEERGLSVNLFNRLVKQSNTTDSSGLGLNIVKSICDKNNFIVQYTYPQKTIFKIEIIFPED